MKRAIRLLLYAGLLVSIFAAGLGTASYAADKPKTITILFTHDMHDHFLPFKEIHDGETKIVGGYARLQTAIYEEKKLDPDALLLDAGDFSMGTPFQTLFMTDAPQLRILGKLGYDAVTFGNHEYDYRAHGLAQSLNAAIGSGDKLPRIVQSNVEFPEDISLLDLEKAYEDCGVSDYIVLDRKDVRIGIFGLMGKEAAKDSPMSGVTFTDQVSNAKRVVKRLQEREFVDLIICLSHSGTWENKSKSEDEILAKEVPEIDIIISGHTHTVLPEPIMKGNTIIGSAGDSCRNLGVMRIVQDENDRWILEDYYLRSIDEKLRGDTDITTIIRSYENLLQKKYFDYFNIKYTVTLSNAPFNFNTVGYMYDHHQEDPLGNLITDAYVYAIEKAEGEDYIPIDAAVVPLGTIRNTFVRGNIKATEVYNVSSLGIGPDQVPGYPLITLYLTGKELKTMCEVDASISPLMGDAQLYISGVSYTFNPKRLIFNKVSDAVLQRKDGSTEKIYNNRLYRVAAGLYSAQMLSIVGEKSFGLMSIVPKTMDGEAVTDYEEHIVYTGIPGGAGGSLKAGAAGAGTGTAGAVGTVGTAGTSGGGGIGDGKRDKGIELKEWYAIAQYLQSFEKVNGIPQIPEYYSKTHGRKVVQDSYNVFNMIRNPNGIALVVYGVVIIVLALPISSICRIIIRKRRLNLWRGCKVVNEKIRGKMRSRTNR